VSLGMTTPDIFGARKSDFRVTCRTDKFAPELQPGDELVVRSQKTAEDGQMVVVMVEADGSRSAYVERYPHVEGHVVGLVIGMSRSLV
jgi:SOS-response transcriptional repressor LexA